MHPFHAEPAKREFCRASQYLLGGACLLFVGFVCCCACLLLCWGGHHQSSSLHACDWVFAGFCVDLSLTRGRGFVDLSLPRGFVGSDLSCKIFKLGSPKRKLRSAEGATRPLLNFRISGRQKSILLNFTKFHRLYSERRALNQNAQ